MVSPVDESIFCTSIGKQAYYTLLHGELIEVVIENGLDHADALRWKDRVICSFHNLCQVNLYERDETDKGRYRWPGNTIFLLSVNRGTKLIFRTFYKVDVVNLSKSHHRMLGILLSSC